MAIIMHLYETTKSIQKLYHKYVGNYYVLTSFLLKNYGAFFDTSDIYQSVY